MEVRAVEDEGIWAYPFRQQTRSQLLLSWEWGVFQQLLGRRVLRWQFVEGETVRAAVQLISQPLPGRRWYWYAPRGPFLFTVSSGVSESVAHHVARALRTPDSGRMFTRFEPAAVSVDSSPTGQANETVETLRRAYLAYGAVPTRSVQPADEFAVLVQHSEERLLAAMHEKTRYNIRLAIRRGVRSRCIADVAYARRALPAFWRLVQATAVRQGIRPHPYAYYERMLESLMSRGRAQLLVAEHDQEIIAAHLLGVYGDTVWYMHGGASYKHRSLMAPFLLHWEGLRLARTNDCTYYNLGGISPIGAAPTHPWQGLTRFKEGFGTIGDTAERWSYPGAFDLVHQRFWYRMYATARSARSALRQSVHR